MAVSPDLAHQLQRVCFGLQWLQRLFSFALAWQRRLFLIRRGGGGWFVLVLARRRRRRLVVSTQQQQFFCLFALLQGRETVSTGEGFTFRIGPFRAVEPTFDPAAKFVAEPKTVFAPRMGAVGSQVQLCCKARYRDRRRNSEQW
jgi:hypothetical protein